MNARTVSAFIAGLIAGMLLADAIIRQSLAAGLPFDARSHSVQIDTGAVACLAPDRFSTCVRVTK